MIKYNDSQLEPVNHVDGPCLVLAGAGSGKTKVITGRIENLVKKHRIKPDNILAVTFTNKAAAEMQERIGGVLNKDDGKKLTCSTFHSLGLNIIRRNYKKLGLRRDFSIYGTQEQLAVVKNAMHNLNKSEEMFDPKLVLWKISSFKSFNHYPDTAPVTDPISSVAREVYREYIKILKQNSAVDFDDLLMHTLYLFNKYPELLEKYRKQFKYILVDEFQDTNVTQYKIIKQLADGHKNIFVVGDDDQSIYGFRGANFENILKFDRDWKGCKTVVLNVNYRSNSTILKAADAVIVNNKERKPKEVTAFNKENVLIEYFEGADEKQEADMIASKIKADGKKLSNYAVLMRANYLSRVLEEAFRASSLPYKLVGAMNFYDRKEVKDIIAYISIINNPNDEVAMLRIINTPKRGIGEATIFEISNYAKQNNISFHDALMNFKDIKMIPDVRHLNLQKFTDFITHHRIMQNNSPLSDTLRSIVKKSGYENMLKNSRDLEKNIKNKLYNIEELINSMEDYEASVKEPSFKGFLDKISLIQDSDDSESRDKVIIMTVHSSKGLEFDTVFMCGMEEGIFPHQKSIDENQVEEERRLCYVAITRAKNRLFMTGSSTRKKYGETTTSKKSRFLDEIPKELFDSKPETYKKDSADNAKEKLRALMDKIKAKYD